MVNGVPVCHSGWDAKEATVVCRMLGYNGLIFMYFCANTAF